MTGTMHNALRYYSERVADQLLIQVPSLGSGGLASDLSVTDLVDSDLFAAVARELRRRGNIRITYMGDEYRFAHTDGRWVGAVALQVLKRHGIIRDEAVDKFIGVTENQQLWELVQGRLGKIIEQFIEEDSLQQDLDKANQRNEDSGSPKASGSGTESGSDMDTVYNIEKVLATGRNNRTQHINDLEDYRKRVAAAVSEASTRESVLSAISVGGSVRSAVVLDDLMPVNDCVGVYDKHIQDLEHRDGDTCGDCDAVRWLMQPASQCRVQKPHRLRIVVEPGNG